MPQLAALVADMDDTMRALSGAGIAAPQIGVSARVVIFELKENPRYPHIRPGALHGARQSRCSRPSPRRRRRAGRGACRCRGCAGLVPRVTRLRYSGFDLAGAPLERTVEGFHARVVQHEVDHLDGILFPQRVRDLRNFGFEDVLAGQLTAMPD